MDLLIKRYLTEWFTGGSHGRMGGLEIYVNILAIGVMMPLLGGRGGFGIFALCLAAAVFPIALVMSATADAFAGERERKTSDNFYLLPFTDRQMYVSGILGPVAFGLIAHLGGMAVGILTLTATGAHIELWEIGAATLAYTVAAIATAFFVSTLTIRGVGSGQVFTIGTYALMGLAGFAAFSFQAISQRVSAPLQGLASHYGVMPTTIASIAVLAVVVSVSVVAAYYWGLRQFEALRVGNL